MTLTPGPWLGLPAVPAVTLYKHDDPALVSFLSLGGTREWRVVIESGGKIQKKEKVHLFLNATSVIFLSLHGVG